MKKSKKRILTGFMALCLIATVILPACAVETDEETTHRQISIRTLDDFIKFADQCSLDSFSRNLEVTLENDLDLSQCDSCTVPIFCGLFDGNGYQITGISSTKNGSVQGLFRYLAEDAVIKNLKVEGTLMPEDGSGMAGGLVGSNAGTIDSCSFRGEVGGSDYIGGLVGINTETGTIRGSSVTGKIHGSHFVGGIAGANRGLIDGCTNGASVNTTEHQNSVALSDITMESLLKTEAVITVTDVGGVAGSNEGAIFSSKNKSPVGYPHMGYNIGGITGSQKGYLKDCSNYGQICGRKEVGGIAGQMEPINKIEFTIDTLQSLQQQLTGLTGMTSQASVNAQNSASALDGNLAVLREESAMALEAVSWLIPNPFDFDLPDLQDVIVAHNVLAGSIGNIHHTMDQMARDTKDAVGQLAKDMQAITFQIAAMSQTISDAPDQLGGRITDVSDLDQKEDLTGKIDACYNMGQISGDLNVGGIVGAVDWENDLDPEDDFQVGGERTLNFDSELRAVILNCTNDGTVCVKKQSAGGIVGRLTMGLVKGSSNTGTITGEQASYLGGIAGYSLGYLRENSVKCKLLGESCIGGIAGSASIVTDCSSMTDIQQGKHSVGAILGKQETDYKNLTDPIKGNVFLDIPGTPDAIDGISYEGKAEPCDETAFRNAHRAPDSFYQSTILFLKENGGVVKRLVVKTGEALPQTQIPEVPPKEGYTGEWEQLSEADLSAVYFDMAFKPVYTAYETTIRSNQAREDGQAILLAEGAFPAGDGFLLEESSLQPNLDEHQRLIEGWRIPVRSESGELLLRYSVPETELEHDLCIYVHSEDGQWHLAESQLKGSYLVFKADHTDDAFCLVTSESMNDVYVIFVSIAGSVLIAAVLFLALSYRKKKNKKKKARASQNN